MTGPLSAALLTEVSRFVREHGLVLWLDKDGVYTSFVNALISGDLRAGFPALQYRGSWLELLTALDPHTGAVDPRPLLVHLPGQNTDSVRTLPIYETYAAGKNFPARRLERLITETASGRVRPERLAGLLATPGLSFTLADAWLAEEESGAADAFDAALRSTPLPAILDDLLGGGPLAARCRESVSREAALQILAIRVGMTEGWLRRQAPPATTEELAFAIAAYAMCVEYAHDLRRAPLDADLVPLKQLPTPMVEICRALAVHLRERHEAFYIRTADEVEGCLPLERKQARPEDQGQVDTLRFEEDVVLGGALGALDENRWTQAHAWAAPRQDGGGFWTRRDPARAAAWKLVAEAATLGEALQAAGPSLDGLTRVEDALDRYVARGAAVDRAHRHLEQSRSALLFASLPHYEKLRAQLDQLRRCWRDWADAWSRDLNLATRRVGFLPDSALQQRTFFEQVVVPLTRDAGCTALFMVDALRYEMGEELARTFSASAEADRGGTQVGLSARLAELPTITAVGMNALVATPESGRLRPVVSASGISGFRSAEFPITTPESRQRAVAARVGGGTCPLLSLGEVLGRDVTSLKQALARARVVIVHCTEIDDAGESGVGLSVFPAALQRLAAAERLLRDAGVRRFVFTADHGFLLNDSDTIIAQSHGRKVDPDRRHVLTVYPADHAAEVRVPLSELGYEGVADQHIISPLTTAVFDQGRKDRSFVHGGPTLQERVIPVITVQHRGAAGTDALRYAVQATRVEGVSGLHCLVVGVGVVDQTGLPFVGGREVELALRAVDAPGAHLEICQVRPSAAWQTGALRIAPGGSVEVFFRVTGPDDRRASVEVYHPSGAADVRPAILADRFDVLVTRATTPAGPPQDDRGWLDALPEGARRIFQHLAVHGSVNESEVIQMLGGASAARRFALHFEEHARRAPFLVRIESVGGLKRYVREGAKDGDAVVP